MADKEDVVKGLIVVGGLAFGLWLIRRLTRHTGGQKKPTSGGDIDLAFVGKVVSDLVTKRALTPREAGELGKIDRHQASFIYRRALTLGSADAALREEPGLGKLKQRVEKEMDQIKVFLDAKVGTESSRGPYFGAPGDDNDPKAKHLDLGKFVHPRFASPSSTEAEAVAAQTKNTTHVATLRELDRRRMRVIGIVWRAGAIDADVWKAIDGTSTLQVANLTEILDRRLRSVERLQYQASAGATRKGIGSSFIERSWQLGNHEDVPELELDGTVKLFQGKPVIKIRAKWGDEYKVRIFEAPSVPRSAGNDAGWEIERLLDSGTEVATNAGAPRFNLVAPDQQRPRTRWYLNHISNELDWNEWPGTRLRDPLADHPDALASEEKMSGFVTAQWTLADSHTEGRGYAWVMKKEEGRHLPADIIRNLFVPSSDWWKRTWLHSDGVMAALHLEALMFAKLRRNGDDVLFNELPKKFSLALDDYFKIRPRLARPANGIMSSGRNAHFENTTIPEKDFQIGDQLLFEVGPIPRVLGIWDYPTVLVTDVDTHPDDDFIDIRNLKLQGFGTVDLDYPSFQLLLAKTLEATFRSMQEFIVSQIAILKAAAAVAHTPFTPPTQMSWDTGLVMEADLTSNDLSILRLWNPYDDKWDEPGPWWIRINFLAPMWGGTSLGQMVSALKQTPGGIFWISDDRLLFEFRGRVELNDSIPVSAGFKPPPWQVSVGAADPRRTIFVPLFEPDDGWVSYFSAKAGNPNANKGSRLNPRQPDASWLFDFAKSSPEGPPAYRSIRPRLETE